MRIGPSCWGSAEYLAGRMSSTHVAGLLEEFCYFFPKITGLIKLRGNLTFGHPASEHLGCLETSKTERWEHQPGKDFMLICVSRPDWLLGGCLT